jgi:hypothetical protein
MREIKFRPFRRVDGKLVVTSYMGWRRIYTANYEGATVNLLTFPEVKKDEVIYSMHNPEGQYKYWYPTKFEPLFWPTNGIIRHIGSGPNSDSVYESGVVVSGRHCEIKENEVYSMFDCDGCPTFSHATGIYVQEHYPNKMHLFEPLTAEIVYKYFEIMRDTLDKVKWLHRKPSDLIINQPERGK